MFLRALARRLPVVVPEAAHTGAAKPKPPAKQKPVDTFTPSKKPQRAKPAVAPVINSKQRFDAVIEAAYQSALGRSPDAEEVSKGREFAATLEQQGKTADEMRNAFAYVIALGPEWQAREAYRATLGREPTAEELSSSKAWGASMQAEGKSTGEMRAAFDFVLAMTPEWQARDAHRQMLGHEPSAEGLQKSIAWGKQLQAEGKSVEELRAAFNFVLAMTPEWQGREAHREMLGRDPSPEELQKTIAWGTQLQAEGKSVEELRASFNFVLAMTPEWQGRDAHRQLLGRDPSPDELSRTVAWGQQLQAEGKSVEEMRAAFNFVLALTPEYQEKHRSRLVTNRDELYLQQPNGWSCGPTSLTMALAACGVRPSNLDTMWDLAGQLGARAGVGTPGGVSLIADVARRNGVNAEWSSSREPGDVRAALERGHGVVVNGDLGGGGHFLYISGLDQQGNYIVCDPWRPGITTWGDGELWEFTHHGNNPPGFAELWPA